MVGASTAIDASRRIADRKDEPERSCACVVAPRIAPSAWRSTIGISRCHGAAVDSRGGRGLAATARYERKRTSEESEDNQGRDDRGSAHPQVLAHERARVA